MHPTIEEQLAAVRRLLDEVATDEGLAERSKQDLASAARQLRRIERSGAARLPFLLADNEACVSLLAEIGATPTIDLAPAVAHETNKRLRSAIADRIHELPDDRESNAWRARVAAHLRHRVTIDPALNRPESLAK